MTTFLDTNVLVYLLDEHSPYYAWASARLDERRAVGPAVISDIVYCEFSVVIPTIAEVDMAIAALSLELIRGSKEALFRAGKAFQLYKENNNGPKLGVLPDFIIGATAEMANAPLMTANAQDYAGYFPDLEIIAPP